MLVRHQRSSVVLILWIVLAGEGHGDSVQDDGLLCEEDGTVTVRDSLDALLQVTSST
jgi:hypothetical protein